MENVAVDFEAIMAKCKCCACDTLLQDSKFLNWAPLPLKANWDFPCWGNVRSGENGKAVAYVCDRCQESAQTGGPVRIKYAVQFANSDIIYHRISEQGGFE